MNVVEIYDLIRLPCFENGCNYRLPVYLYGNCKTQFSMCMKHNIECIEHLMFRISIDMILRGDY